MLSIAEHENFSANTHFKLNIRLAFISGKVAVKMKVQLLVRGKELFHLVVKVMRDHEKSQGHDQVQGQVLAADLEVDRVVDQDLEADLGQGPVLSLEVDQGHDQDQEVDQQSHGQVQGQGLVVQQGLSRDQDQNLVVQQGQGLEVLQHQKSQVGDLHLGHQLGQKNLEVKGHQLVLLIHLQALVVRQKTDHYLLYSSVDSNRSSNSINP